MASNVLQPSGPVVPVADYEPPAVGAAPVLPPVPAARSQRARRAPVPPRRIAEDPTARAAAAFADAAARRVLEVIDRRRPLAQLRPLLAAGLVDSLLPAAGRNSGGGPARLRRVRVRMAAQDGTAAEVAVTYCRGERVRALACRIEQVATPAGPRWQVVALHLG